MRNKTWTTLAAAALLGPAMLLSACKSDGSGDDNKTDNASSADGANLAEPVEMVDRASGSSSALKTIGTTLIRTQAEYDALGDENIFPGDLDFDEYDLVVVALGERSSGGYSVEITGIQRVGRELAVTGKATKPAADAFVTTALTYPYDAVAIPNTDATSVVPYID